MGQLHTKAKYCCYKQTNRVNEQSGVDRSWVFHSTRTRSSPQLSSTPLLYLGTTKLVLNRSYSELSWRELGSELDLRLIVSEVVLF